MSMKRDKLTMQKLKNIFSLSNWRQSLAERARTANAFVEMSPKLLALFDWRKGWAARARATVAVVLVVAGALAILSRYRSAETPDQDSSASSQLAKRGVFVPTAKQWQSLTIRSADNYAFRFEVTADGKIAIDEDNSTPIFSPYSGRVTRIVAKPGDPIKAGQLLLALEATDMVQAQNDFITAVAGLDTARSQQNLAQINEKRQHELFDGKAVPLKDWQQAQADLITAESNARSAEIAVEAVRNRLRLLQKSEDEIVNFQKTGKINPETPIFSPIDGTVVQRKVGPGQYITSGASDPTGDSIFVVGNSRTVWLVANVKETDGSRVQLGQPLEFRLSAFPDRVFTGKVDYVAEAFDPNTRRLMVRATIENPDKLLKPDMFASVIIFASEAQPSPAVPREAIIYEGSDARVWVAADDKSLALRKITLGMVNGNLVQVLSGLQSGEKIITRGALFIDRAASGGET
jgi:cobalt-zinc-cadmium efflux system membrane fusion protein